jgi:holo-[acyl-carrier protein] synthase
MQLRTGIDLIEIGRIQAAVRRHGNRYLDRIYTAAELSESKETEYLAGRFAAKEAVAKALGTGIGAVGWKDIEILGDDRNAPVLGLHGEAQELSRRLGVVSWAVSISHSVSHAVGLAVALLD